MSATQLMTVSVYGVDEAFSTVRLFAGSFEAGITSGKSDAKSASTAAATVIASSVKAIPSAPRRLAIQPPMRATAAIAARIQNHVVPNASPVQRRKEAATTI